MKKLDEILAGKKSVGLAGHVRRMGIVWAPHSEFTTISGNIIRMWMCDCILSRFPISLNF